MIIRPATTHDLPSILDIYNWAVLNTTASAEYEPNTLAVRQAWFESHVHDGLPVLVAEDAGRVLGWSSLSKYHARRGYRFTVEDSVYVHHDFWGRGIGKTLVAPLIESARQLGKHAIIASIDASGTASIRLHTSLGFVQAGYYREIIYKFDRWHDCVHMQLMLSQSD